MAGSKLKILHVLRAPVGGLFRHVIDLAQGQAARGHNVGIVAADTDSPAAREKFSSIAPDLALGISRIAMSRRPGLGDLGAVRHVSLAAAAAAPDVLHGHGAKGGAYVRLANAGRAIRVYTPHGGSLHYGSLTPQGLLYGFAERLLKLRTDLLLFESAFARSAFAAKMGEPGNRARVVHNGVAEAEFAPVAPAADAADVVVIGELRHLKGIDILIEAAALLAARRRRITVAVVGAGPDEKAFRALAVERGLSESIRFSGYRPAREGFAMGRVLAVPSRAESLPYIVLEAAAAALPMVATRVGGIPEIFGPDRLLVTPGDPAALADALLRELEDPAAASRAAALRDRVRSFFSQDAMVEGVLEAYETAIAAKFQRSH